MTVKGLLFDKDGTLFDFEATWSAWLAGMLTELFGDRAAEMGARLGFVLETREFLPTSPVIAETTEHVAGLLLPHLADWDRDALLAKMRAAAAATVLVEPVALAPLLHALKGRGLALGVATNDDEGSARAHLARAGVADLFGFVAGYDSGWGGKPDAGQMRAFLDWAGLAPGEAVMVGDSLHDMAAGRAAGMRCVAVLTGPATEEVLGPAADAVLRDISELPGWLDRGAGG